MGTKKADRYFLPGDNFKIQDAWRRGASPVYERVRVTAPGRLHFNVLDFTKMQPITPGGGGFGISTTTAMSEIKITLGGDGPEAPTPTSAHLVRLFSELVGYRGGDIRVAAPRRITYSHSGFGSNVTFNTGIVAGLNALFGTPFSVPEMWDILTQNFVENADEERLYWGLETGVGEACLFYGGLVWVDEHARYLGSASADGMYAVTAAGIVEKLAGEALAGVGEANTKGVGDAEEVDLVATECQAYEAKFGEEHRRFLRERLKPALLRDDIRAFLELGWELNKVGTYRVHERFYRSDVLREVAACVRENKGLYFNISSAGPSMFALTDSVASAADLCEALERKFGELFRGFAYGKAGTKICIEVAG